MKSKVRLGLGLGMVLSVSACMLDTGARDEGEPSIESAEQPLGSAYFRNLALTVVSCKEIKVSFDRVSTLNNRPVVRYRLYRDATTLVTTVVPDPTKGSTIPVTIRDGWMLPGSGWAHRYEVEVENDAGYKEKSAWVEYRPLQCPEPSNTSFVIIKLTPSDLAAPTELAADGRVSALLGTDARSATAYFKEVSYGRSNLTFAEYPGWFRMGVTHSQLCGGTPISTVKGVRACSAPDDPVAVREEQAVLATVLAQYPGKIPFFVMNGITASTGKPRLAAVDFVAPVRWGAGVYHELGHYLYKFTEGWDLYCNNNGNYAFPALLSGIRGPDVSGLPCNYQAYGQPFDPMNGAPGHFHALHKLQAGWIKGSGWQNDGNVWLHGSLLSAGGSTPSFKLQAVDKTTLSSTDKVAFLYQLPDNGGAGFYAFEYRRPVGMNSHVSGFKQGVYVTALPGVNPTTETWEADSSVFIHGDILAPSPVEEGRNVITTAKSFFDPHRKLRASVSSSNNDEATVKVEWCHATSAVQCTATQDVPKKRMAGYCCFCTASPGAIPTPGAWIQKTSSTLQCSLNATPTR